MADDKLKQGIIHYQFIPHEYVIKHIFLMAEALPFLKVHHSLLAFSLGCTLLFE